MRKIFILLCVLLIGSIALFSGCVGQKAGMSGDVSGPDSSDNISLAGSTQELKKFSSASEIREFLKAKSSALPSGSYRGEVFATSRDMMGVEEMAVAEEASGAPMGAPAPKSSSIVADSGASEYSTTNIQVGGVDEADFVKNDGKYIYTLVQDKLVIVNAFPAEDASILSTTEVNGSPRNMLVKGDRLLVFSEAREETLFYPEYDFRPRTRYSPQTLLLVYDISDRKNPVLVRNYSLNGNYFQSRMIGDYVYFIVKDNVYYYDDFIDVPVIRESSEKILAPEIYYFDNPEQNYVFHTIASLNLKDEHINAKSFMMGYSDNLYVSRNNIYIAYHKNLPYTYYQNAQKDAFYTVVVPLLPQDAQDKIDAIQHDSDVNPVEKWERVSSVLEKTYDQMDDTDRQSLFNKIEDAIGEYSIKMAREQEKTIIQKIKVDKGEITHEATGEVQGTLLNQFSMDEHNGFLRVATTFQFWTRKQGPVQFNNVYVLDSNLKPAGKLEEIAPDERIYSTRFIGDRLYMVTFKRTDPLFVIDLSNTSNPGVLGKLKIPGFSDYLHPYDENHLIGVGRETGTNEWGGVSIKGVKLSLFDVSNVKNPVQTGTYEIGTSGMDSEALRDHKAFLFDKKKNLLVIPVREILEEREYNERYGYYAQKVWQGAYIFNLTVERGFNLKGKVTHLSDYEREQYYWRSPGAVRRSLYMDDVLYTISSRKILMNELNDLSEINSINLPFKERDYPTYERY